MFVFILHAKKPQGRKMKKITRAVRVLIYHFLVGLIFFFFFFLFFLLNKICGPIASPGVVTLREPSTGRFIVV